jgi:hypothetical protein
MITGIAAPPNNRLQRVGSIKRQDIRQRAAAELRR